jgi:hypothetical protein
MQKNRVVITREDGVKVLVKVIDPKIFAILDQVGVILKNQTSSGLMSSLFVIASAASMAVWLNTPQG